MKTLLFLQILKLSCTQIEKTKVYLYFICMLENIPFRAALSMHKETCFGGNERVLRHLTFLNALQEMFPSYNGMHYLLRFCWGYHKIFPFLIWVIVLLSSYKIVCFLIWNLVYCVFRLKRWLCMP
jgi:hypothetical protein